MTQLTTLTALAVKWLFVGQPDNLICWAISMQMASISTNLHALNFKICSNWILVELENDNFLFWVFFEIFFCFSQWKSALLSYEVSFFLHYGWFLQNLELDFIPTLCTYPFIFLALHFPLKQNYIIINQIGKLVVCTILIFNTFWLMHISFSKKMLFICHEKPL